MKLLLVLGVFLIVAHGGGAAGASEGSGCEAGADGFSGSLVARTDHRPSGNRVAESCGLVGGEVVVDVELGGVPAHHHQCRHLTARR